MAVPRFVGQNVSHPSLSSDVNDIRESWRKRHIYIYKRDNCSCYHVFDPVDQQLEHTTNIATGRHGDDAKVVLFTNPD